MAGPQMQTPHGPRAALLAGFVLALCLGTAAAAITGLVGPSQYTITFADLKPTIDTKYSHTFYYQIPPNPRGAVLLVHGCVHSGYNYFPRSAYCPECRGLPEELSHTLQSLNRGYAVIAVSSGDRETGCWSWNDDSHDVKHLVEEWQEESGLKGLPLYGMGISSGASFVLKLPRYLKLDGVVSEALGVDPEYWSAEKVKDGYPAALFVAMMRDEQTVAKILEDRRLLAQLGRPVSIVKVYPRLVYPTYFYDRDPYYISKDLSLQVVRALRKIGMIDKEGTVLLDPRYTTRPWLKLLKAEVRELQGPVTTFKGVNVPEWNDTIATDTKVAAVYSLMNLAYAYHEIISDYATVALMWFESGNTADLAALRAAYTYGEPPLAYRQASAAVAEEPLAALMPQTALGGGATANDAAAMGTTVFRRSAREVVPGGATLQARDAWRSRRAGAGQGVAGAGPAAGQDEELLAAAEEVEQALDPARELALSVPLPERLISRGGAPHKRASKMLRFGQPGRAWLRGGIMLGGFSTLPGSAVGGAALFLLLVALAWLVVKHARSAAAGISLQPSTMQARHQHAPAVHHAAAGAAARLSIVPGVKERFECAVVEQTGSPFSARRRVKTAFHESPRKAGSPRKKGAQ